MPSFTRLRALVLALAIWSLPYVVAAQCATDTSGNTFTNPLRFCTIKDFVAGVLQVFVLLMLPVIAFFIVLSGLNFVLARGNSDALKKAKWNFLYVIIGTCLMLGAWVLATLIGATVTQITGTQ